MRNKYFPDEEVSEDDLYFICYMIERVSRHLHQRNSYVVNSISKDKWIHLISCAQVLHSENPLKVENDWIEENNLVSGDFFIEDVDRELCAEIPTAIQMGKVYSRLVLSTLSCGEDFIDALVRVYNNPICSIIDNYNCSAYYEPSYVIERAYLNGGF